MKTKNFRKYNSNYTKKKNRFIQQAGGDINLPNLVNSIDQRLSFFKNQPIDLKYLDIITTVNDLYNDYEQVQTLSISGRILRIEGASQDVTSTEQIDDRDNEKVKEMKKLAYNVKQFRDDTFIKDNCYVVLNTLHGSHENIFEPYNNFKKVPPNTMICFLSSLDNLTIHPKSIYNNINRQFPNINEQQFISLFKHNINLTQGKMNSTIPINDLNKCGLYEMLPYYNCFIDSMWYFPGQLYPELDNSLMYQDTIPGGIDFYTWDKAKKTVNKEKDSIFFDNEYLNSTYLSVDQPKYTKHLSDLVNYDLPTIPQIYKLVIVGSCRPIYFKAKKKLFQLELYTYHLNKKIMEPTQPNMYSIDAVCSYISEKQFCFINKKNPKLSEYINDNYSGKVPILQKIYLNLIGTHITKDYIYYLSSLSFNKMFKFLNKILEDTRLTNSKLIIKNVIKNLLRYCYPVLNSNFKKYMGYFTKSTEIINPENDKASGFGEVIDVMDKLSNLFVKYTGIENLFFRERFSIFYEDYTNLKFNTHVVINYRGKIVQINPISNILRQQLEIPGLSNIDPNTNTLVIDHGIIRNSTTNTYDNIKKLVIHKELNLIKINHGFLGTIGFRKENTIDYLIELFPNLEILVFKNCYLSRTIFESHITNETLHTIKLINTNIILDNINVYPNLKHYEICNNTVIDKIIIRNNKNLNNIILEDIPNLKILNIFISTLKLNTLCLVGYLKKLMNFEIKINYVENFIIRDCNLTKFATNFTNTFRCKNLELINVDINTVIYKKLISNPRETFSLYSSTVKKGKLHVVRFHDNNGKSEIIEFIFLFNDVEVYNITHDGKNLVIENTDLKSLKLKKKKNIYISAEHLANNLTSKNKKYFKVV